MPCIGSIRFKIIISVILESVREHVESHTMKNNRATNPPLQKYATEAQSPPRDKSIFSWLRQRASNKNLHLLDGNSDNFIAANEIIDNFEKDNQYSTSKGEKQIAEVILKEADSDHNGLMSVNELNDLIFGQNNQRIVKKGNYFAFVTTFYPENLTKYKII